MNGPRDQGTPDYRYLGRAVELALLAGREGFPPFGALMVLKDEVIAEARNEVIQTNDVTAHAEILVIRRASLALQARHFPEGILYCSCEPCLMCAGAVIWSQTSRVVFSASREVAQAFGFHDCAPPSVSRNTLEVGRCEVRRSDTFDAASPFEAWASSIDRQSY